MGFPNLIPETRNLLAYIGRPYVIENVHDAPLRQPVTFCGSSFGLDVRRHRDFESSFPLTAPACKHYWQTPRFKQSSKRTNLRSTVEVGSWRIPSAQQQQAMGIYWTDKVPELSEAIPPDYTHYIGAQVFCELMRSEDG